MAVGAYITQVRTALGVSRSQLSRDAGVSEMTMMRIESGLGRDGDRYLMRSTMAYKVARALGIDPNELLEPLGYTLATQSTTENLEDRLIRIEAAVDQSLAEQRETAAAVQALIAQMQETLRTLSALTPKPNGSR